VYARSSIGSVVWVWRSSRVRCSSHGSIVMLSVPLFVRVRWVGATRLQLYAW